MEIINILDREGKIKREIFLSKRGYDQVSKQELQSEGGSGTFYPVTAGTAEYLGAGTGCKGACGGSSFLKAFYFSQSNSKLR